MAGERAAGRPPDGPADSSPPWHRILHAGPDQLCDADLVAVLLGRRQKAVQVAESLLIRTDGLLGLASAVRESTTHRFGLAKRQAALVTTAFELARRLGSAKRRLRPCLRTAADVARLVAGDMATLTHEELWCLPLDAHHQLIGDRRVVSTGDVDGTDAGPRGFFRHALMAGATSAIAVHNHPTGNPEPSGADRAVTLRLAGAGRAVDVPLVDHVVIGDGGRHVSLRTLEPGLFR